MLFDNIPAIVNLQDLFIYFFVLFCVASSKSQSSARKLDKKISISYSGAVISGLFGKRTNRD
jgi:hypothetical protein